MDTPEVISIVVQYLHRYYDTTWSSYQPELFSCLTLNQQWFQEVAPVLWSNIYYELAVYYLGRVESQEHRQIYADMVKTIQIGSQNPFNDGGLAILKRLNVKFNALSSLVIVVPPREPDNIFQCLYYTPNVKTLYLTSNNQEVLDVFKSGQFKQRQNITFKHNIVIGMQMPGSAFDNSRVQELCEFLATSDTKYLSTDQLNLPLPLIKQLSSMSSLERFGCTRPNFFEGIEISDKTFSSVTAMRLVSEPISQLRKFGTFKNLRTLTIGPTNIEAIKTVVVSCPNLTSLSVQFLNEQFTDAHAEAIKNVSKVLDLEILQIMFMYEYSPRPAHWGDRDMGEIAHNMPRLRQLSLQIPVDLMKYTSETLRHFQQHCKHLEILEIYTLAEILHMTFGYSIGQSSLLYGLEKLEPFDHLVHLYPSVYSSRNSNPNEIRRVFPEILSGEEPSRIPGMFSV